MVVVVGGFQVSTVFNLNLSWIELELELGFDNFIWVLACGGNHEIFIINSEIIIKYINLHAKESTVYRRYKKMFFENILS